MTESEYKKKKLQLNTNEKILLAKIEKADGDVMIDSAELMSPAVRLSALALKGFITCRKQANSTLYRCRAIKPGEEISFEDQFYVKYTRKSEAIKDATQAMYLLNRFCKNKRLCSNEQKEAIYELKAKWVNFLYDSGYCIEAHLQQVKAPTCPSCQDRADFPKGEFCASCGRKGGIKDEFYVFRFKVGKRTYQWHLPLHLFPHKLEVNKRLAPMNKLKAKDLFLNPNEVTEKLALVKWVLLLN